MAKVELIKGGVYKDERGILQYVNDFSFSRVNRFYQITPADTATVRAWQGHKIEHKYFYVPKGKFVLAWVEIDDWHNPSADLKAEHVILSQDEPAVLSVPNGYANGIKALEPGSVLMIFSDTDLQQSTGDRWVYDSSLWFDWNNL